MNDVFECSYLTIVATSARSSTDGFLKRPGREVVTLPYRDDNDPTIAGKFYLTQALVGGYPWALVDETAWNTRGWSEFSPRKLTYRSDSLSALSGLALIFKQAYTEEDEYIAGLWRKDFPHGLLWTVEKSNETSKALDYWAPSWSWASVAGEVYWPTRTIERHQRDDFTVELRDIKLRVGKENSMGTVLGGYIRMRGRLRLLSCITKPVEWGAFLRYRYDLWCDGKVVGNGGFDVDHDDTAEGVWLLQMHVQQPGDGYFPYHPTALMLQSLPGSWMKFVRLGCAVLDDEQLDFFDLCEPQEFEFY
ncbi:MAG: hypothetical protein Q9166_003110 [cf. Caloplaca sp. 2 TL-2023]